VMTNFPNPVPGVAAIHPWPTLLRSPVLMPRAIPGATH